MINNAMTGAADKFRVFHETLTAVHSSEHGLHTYCCARSTQSSTFLEMVNALWFSTNTNGDG